MGDMIAGTVEKVPLLAGTKIENVLSDQIVRSVWYVLKDDPDDPNNNKHSVSRRQYLLKYYIESSLAKNPIITDKLVDKEQTLAKSEQPELRNRRPSSAPLSAREEVVPCVACATCIVL